DATKARIAYTFSIGSGDDANYRASGKYVVTAGMEGLFTAYAASAANQSAGTTVVKPPSGVKWNAYAADGDYVYIVDTSTPGATSLLRWQPGGTPYELFTLES